MKIQEGYMPFGPYRTYYRIAGERVPGKAPLLLLHGGPGSTHNYFEVLDPLVEAGHQLIMYDQIGCGLSSIPDDDSLWTAETWLNELEAIREHLGLDEVHILGQSWGGMLAIEYMCDCDPKGVVSLILASTLHSNSQWEKEGRRNISYLPLEMQQAIAKAEETGDYSDPAYQAAESAYMVRHCNIGIPEEDRPECVRRPATKGRRSYVVAWGPNEFTPAGTLKNHEYLDKLPNISCPTLVTSGLMDICTPLVAKTMADTIPGARWELFEHSRHCAFVEENEKYLKILGKWLDDTDQARA